MTAPRRTPRRGAVLFAAAGLTLAAALACAGPAGAADGTGTGTGTHDMGGMQMSDDEMADHGSAEHEPADHEPADHGTVHRHDASAATASGPSTAVRTAVLGGFAGVNGAVLLTAGALRTRAGARAHRRSRARAAAGPARSAR